MQPKWIQVTVKAWKESLQARELVAADVCFSQGKLQCHPQKARAKSVSRPRAASRPRSAPRARSAGPRSASRPEASRKRWVQVGTRWEPKVEPTDKDTKSGHPIAIRWESLGLTEEGDVDFGHDEWGPTNPMVEKDEESPSGLPTADDPAASSPKPMEMKAVGDMAASSTGYTRPEPTWSSGRGRSEKITREQLRELRAEQFDAEENAVPWAERGPRGEDAPEFWRGQTLRPGLFGGKMRYANRGGRHREYYAELAKQGRLVPGRKGSCVGKAGEAYAAMDAAKAEKGKGRGKGKSKGDGGKRGTAA